MNKLIVILGPTASGKSAIAVKLAKKYNGEVLSVDSRQVYKEMDIGTGKITRKEMQGIPHYLLDVVSPKTRFSVTQYRKIALKAIDKVFKKGKIPILCGGSYFYIKAIVDGLIIPQVKPDWQLRKTLGKKTAKELFQQLKKLDPERAKTIEKENKRRLIRALEIVVKTKRPVPQQKKQPLPYPVLMIGIKKESKIKKRVGQMFKLGLENEVKGLVKKYKWTPALQTIGYQEWKEFFDGKINKKEVEDLIICHTRQFAKRQITWLKRDKRINWVKNYKEAKFLVLTKF